MLKWVFRVIYVLFLFGLLIIIEINLGGIDGLQRGDYANEYIVKDIDAYSDETTRVDVIHDTLARYTAVIDNYYSSDLIGDQYYDTTDEAIDEDYQVKIGLYPFVSFSYEESVDLYYDGFFIVLEEANADVDYYRVVVNAVNENDTETLVTYESDESYIYTDPENFFLNQTPTYTSLVRTVNFYSVDENEDKNGFYDVVGISIYAVIDGEETFIYRITDGSTTFAGSPLVEDTNLVLTSDDYILSQFMDGDAPTDGEIALYNLVTTYHPVDLSVYWWWPYIIYSIYIVFFAVIPYFMLFHKRVVKALNDKKAVNDKMNYVKEKRAASKDQIFKD